MITLHGRLVNAYNFLVDEGVFLSKYNNAPFCKCPNEQLQLVTNYLSVSDLKLISTVCEFYHLDCGINYCPSLKEQNLCVIFEDKNNG